ncbi:MAG TPA: SMP-30/gluconolactonase/LRE family protein [Burkholderiaceae bacterium]|nr:SMP-30/gluconolactonase/LRE family protein [Burkholderiaceae bacterium]
MPDVPPSVLGESPLWHPAEQVLYWCDIPGHSLNRFDPQSGAHARWSFETDVTCCAPLIDGGLLLALRSGLVRFDPATGERRTLLAPPPYDPATERFNDGKADPQGRMWVGTIHEPREPKAALYRFADGELDRMADGITVSNGLAWSPDARTMYWSDTKAHTIYALDFEASDGSIANRRVFAPFPIKQAGQDLATYGGRPDGAAVDAEGHYWAAMFEGKRIVRIAPDGRIVREVALPVRCPTMPCFGGPDLKTLYITTARENRPADELAREPLAGCVLQMRVDVPGLPANFTRA